MSPTKIALILAGGVSLGSYEAGVLTAMLDKLEELNPVAGEPKYVIDVMTGGSAGSLTAALVARRLMHDFQGLRDKLHEVWVEQADIQELMAQPGRNALLSNATQRRVAHELIEGSSDYPLRVTAPARCAPPELKLGFSLSNMVGIDFGLPYVQLRRQSLADNAFRSTFFSDYADFSLNATNLVDPATWRQISTAAQASGAFPIAFPPVPVPRVAENYRGALPESTAFLPADMGCVDGGMFNNEPIKQAIQLANDLDGGLLSDERIFILIDPNLNRSKQNLDFSSEQSLVANTLRLAEMAFGEMQAQDWLRVGRVNTELKWRDELAGEFGYLVAALPAEALPERRASADRQIDTILDEKARVKGGPLPVNYLSVRLARIRDYHQHVWGDRGLLEGKDGQSRLELFERLVFILDNAAGLNSKAPMRLHVIAADGAMTAGDAFLAFLGFFNQPWREHDYQLGAKAAYDLLPEILGLEPLEAKSGGGPRSGLVAVQRLERPDTLAKVDIKDVDRDKRKQIIALARARLDAVLAGDDLRVGWLWRQLAKILLWVALRKVLRLGRQPKAPTAQP